ncbi:Protein of uncharacterised function (DUF732) [Nocardia cyriacigeorgica]|uniref:Protein of uncharacterized function (DUF732) n=2 Tax=Nocardia cyriacigeorgica TaxID=135487 RepID=A0A4U8VT52_9NOCA|nr:Protein of uncharacterised function (DUF732) [Nocardia cyriacigeorgica]
MYIHARLAASALAAGTAVTLMTGAAQTAAAAPIDSGSASGSAGHAAPSRSAADLQFLRDSYHRESSYAVQDAAIRLAHSQCGYLDAYGNTARNHIYLAESSRNSVEYPYTFLDAAINAYCPWNQL